MATAESPQTEPPANPSSPLAEEWVKLRMAHEAMMLADSQALLRADRATVEAHNKQFLGDGYAVPPSDDMIHIGDVTNTYTAPPAAQQPASIGMSTLGKVATGAALLLGGAGTGAAVVNALRPDPPAAVAPVDTDTDTDTQFRLVLPDGKNP